MDPDQDRRFVGPDLDLNCLQMNSTDDTGMQSANIILFYYYYSNQL